LDNNDLNNIEQMLGLKLPQAYREILLSYPFDIDANIYDRDLYQSAASVIEQNQMYRKSGFFGQKWPAHYLVIGSDAFGNLHFLDLTQPKCLVFFADHEDTAYSDTIEAEEEAANLSDWVKHMQEQAASFQAQVEQLQRSAEERKRNKKWWQFWI